MKNISKRKTYILGGVIATSLFLGLTSCNPLGIEPTTKVDEARFWENPQLARSYVNNFYTLSESASGDNFQSEQWSDNCQGNYEQDWDTYRQTSFTQRQYDETSSPTCFTAPWVSAYQNIHKINRGLQFITSSGALTSELKNQLLAECYFFRAFVYFDMEKYWGTVPYVEIALTPSDNTYLPQIKREELFDKILSDLNKSLELFQAINVTPSRGMVNKDVVRSFISRVALYAANAAEASSKGIYKDDSKGLFKFEKQPSHYYQLAYDAAKEVMNAGYALEKNYSTLFTSETAHTSKESIWPVMFKENERDGFNPTGKNGPDSYYYGGTTEKSYQWEFRSGLFPTQDLVDCYLQKDEQTGEWKNWWETSQMKALQIKAADGQYSGTGEAYRKMYENRDQRFYATVTYDGAYMGPEQPMYQIQTWIDNSNISKDDKNSLKYSALHTGYREVDNLDVAPVNRASAQTLTGYYSRKYSHFDAWNEDGTMKKNQRTTCYFNIRYAEVLLNHAEAAIKLNKPEEAQSDINQIRLRAGLSEFTGSDLWKEMQLQRRLEFAFECPGFRYFDLLRWNEAAGNETIKELNTPSRGIHIFRKGKESTTIGEQGYPMESGQSGYFTPKFETFTMPYANYKRSFDNARYYFMPYDQTMLNDYRQLQQNPGWKNFKYNN